MNVAWFMFWGGSRSTKPCVFPCKVAAGDDERYLVCATGAAAGRSGRDWFLLCVLQQVVVPVVSFYAFPEAVVADRIVMAACMLHGLCFGEEAGARQLCAQRCSVLRLHAEYYCLLQLNIVNRIGVAASGCDSDLRV